MPGKDLQIEGSHALPGVVTAVSAFAQAAAGTWDRRLLMDRNRLLYRKVNTRARGVHHRSGGDFARHRNAKRARNESSMHAGQRRGLDYTRCFASCSPGSVRTGTRCFRRRLPGSTKPSRYSGSSPDTPTSRRVGEGTDYSGLYIDDDNPLAVVDPGVTPQTMTPLCDCCTHTLNGVRFS